MRTLNEAQQAAVETDLPRVAVIAGPGSGKTEVICRRVDAMVRDGRKVAVVTLTNSAADEIAGRLTPGNDPWFCGTIHGLALRIIKSMMPGITVLSEVDAEALELEACQRVGYKGTRKAFERAKAGLLETGYLTGERGVVAAVRSWLTMQADGGVLTFDGLLHFAADLLGNASTMHGLHLVVDEGQDCALVDYRLFRLLTPVSVFLVGDPDQAIFGFRGGSHRAFLRFVNGCDRELVLDANYRCPDQVCKAANSLIFCNSERIEKFAIPRSGDGIFQKLEFDSFDHEMAEIQVYVSMWKSIVHSHAIICRTNQIADAVRTALGLKEQRTELPQDWAKCRRLLAMLANPRNDWLASMAAESCGLGDAKMWRAKSLECGIYVSRLAFSLETANFDWLSFIAHHVSQESVFRIKDHMEPDQKVTPEFLLKLDEADADKSDSIVMTIHRAKGREFDHVWIPCFDEDQYGGDDVEELRRLAFVAMTRARKTLTVSWSKERPGYGGKTITTEASPMLAEMLGGAR